MKTVKLLLIACVFWSIHGVSLAQVKAEPPELTKARKNYDKKIVDTIYPITKAYLEKLEELKREYGAKGELESAQAIQSEINKVGKANKSTKIASVKTHSIVGKWQWHDTESIEIKADGTARWKDNVKQSNTGRWRCVDQKNRKYYFKWVGEAWDFAVMSEDGNSLSITSNVREPFSATKLNDE